MQKAAFSIEQYTFDKVIIDLNNKKSNEISLAFNTKGKYFKNEAKYELTFSVTAFNEENTIESPFIKVQCVGLFGFENVSSIEEIPEFFYRNCIAILFPYLRAFVSMVTTQANMSGIILPTYNLSSLEGDLRNNTVQL